VFGVGDGEGVAGVVADGDAETVGVGDDATGAHAIATTLTNASTTKRSWITDLDLPNHPRRASEARTDISYLVGRT
jgi:hypothetical protein